jgi:hypothetical protein
MAKKIPESKRKFIADLNKLLTKHDIGMEFDNSGQVVIYTGLMLNDQDELVPWEDDGTGYAAK